MVTRILDLAVLLLLAFAILMPRPNAKVKPALAAGPAERDRVAELQARLFATPGDGGAALELADIFMDGRRADWALAVLQPAIEASPADHRLFLRRALALADHFEAAAAYQAAARALALCEAGGAVRCDDTEHSRIALVERTLARVKHIDMRKDPNAAKEQILKALRPAYLPKR